MISPLPLLPPLLVLLLLLLLRCGGEGSLVSPLNEGFLWHLLRFLLQMAADILLHGADYVLVGEDQEQHLEFCRATARKINASLPVSLSPSLSLSPRLLVREPVCLLASPLAARVRCLRSPSLKMSKSDVSAAGRVQLMDPPSVVSAKVAKAATDSLPGKKKRARSRAGEPHML